MRRFVPLIVLGATVAIIVGTLTPASAQSSGASTSTIHEAGVLRLRLGAQDHFRFQVPAPSPPGHYIDTTPLPTTQSLTIQSGCRLAATSGLAELSASGGQGQVGFFGDSLGVREGPSGQPCGQIDSPNQLLALKLGTGLAGKAIDFAEIDIEGKFNAKLEVNGYSIDAADSCSSPAPTQLVASEMYDLTIGSDSGPDSGDGDNYRLRFPKLAEDEAGNPVAVKTAANCITFKATAGAVSLEGGSDGTQPCDTADGCIEPSLGQTIDDTAAGAPTFTTDSLFHLIEADGVLDCGDDPVSQTNGGITTTVARLDNVGGAPCTPVPYNLDSSQGPEGCDPDDEGFLQCIFLQKDLDEQQAQFFWKVEWAPEEGSYMEEPTQFDFGTGTFVPLQLCGESTGPVENPPAGFPTFYPTPSSDPWCAVNTQTELQPDGQVVVTEIFFGVADPTGRR
jgi:hypothetical protein